MIEVLETLGIPVFLLGTILVGSSPVLQGFARYLALVVGIGLLLFIPGVVHA